jgi:hypothetical protein
MLRIAFQAEQLLLKTSNRLISVDHQIDLAQYTAQEFDPLGSQERPSGLGLVNKALVVVIVLVRALGVT